MKKQQNYVVSFLMVIFLIVASCSDDIYDIAPPGDELSDANFFVSEPDAQAALIAVYDGIQKQSAYEGADFMRAENYPLGDIVVSTGEADDFTFGLLQWDAQWFRLGNYWNTFYIGITRANLVIERVSQMTDDQLEKDKRDVIVAQAKYLRAIMYFPLVRLFGDIPLVTAAPSLEGDLFPSRAPEAEIWALIRSDLTDAAEVLPLEWPESDLGRATKGSALAMLTKTSLFTQEYEKTAEYAEDVIALGQYGLESNYRDVFSDFNEWNQEIIFATRYSEQVVGGWADDNEGNINLPLTLTTGVPQNLVGDFGGWGGIGVSQGYKDSFEKNASDSIIDERWNSNFLTEGRKHPELDWVYRAEENNHVEPMIEATLIKYWYKGSEVGFYSGQDQVVSKFSEVLLDYAEALNELGRQEEALVQLNRIRSRAGLPDFSSSDSQEILLQIMEERRKENFTEHLLFSDLNRRGLFLDYVKENHVFKDQIDFNKPFLQTQPVHFPIPTAAIEVNPNLTQNEGYN